MSLVVVKDKESFDAALGEFAGLIVVDFYADWCGPCKQIAPVFKDFATEFPNVKFLKVNVDECEDVAGSCNISAMPTFQFYKGGKKIDELVGANVAKLKAIIEKHK